MISCRCWGQGWELNMSQAERQERRRANRAGEGREKTEQKQKHLWPHWAGRAGTGTMATCSVGCFHVCPPQQVLCLSPVSPVMVYVSVWFLLPFCPLLSLFSCPFSSLTLSPLPLFPGFHQSASWCVCFTYFLFLFETRQESIVFHTRLFFPCLVS